MTPPFDKDYWEAHWQQAHEHAADRDIAPNPHLVRELGGVNPGTALDAGCGEGAEAIWLATQGWQVTAADISAEVLTRASARAVAASVRVEWIEVDLSVWEPGKQFDLVTTHYAHPAMPQLALYERISEWVAPGGRLLIVGHLHRGDAPAHAQNEVEQHHGDKPPEEASVTAASVTAVFDPSRWDILTAGEPVRILTNRAGDTRQLDDVVVHAIRRPQH